MISRGHSQPQLFGDSVKSHIVLSSWNSGISMNSVSGINQQMFGSDTTPSAAYFYIME